MIISRKCVVLFLITSNPAKASKMNQEKLLRMIKEAKNQNDSGIEH